MVGKFPEFSRFSLIFLKKSPFFQVFQVFSEPYEPCKKLRNIHINLKYKNALRETNNLLLYGEFDGVLTIDADRNVFTDYL